MMFFLPIYFSELFYPNLYFISITLIISLYSINFITTCLNINLITLFFIKTNILNALWFVLKFIILISLMVFIRGGIPRYRYDFLTKIGWIKFLSLILSVFLTSLLFVYIL